MDSAAYKSMNTRFHLNRRDFIKTSGIVSAGLLLGSPSVWAQDKDSEEPPPRPKTNIEEVLSIPRTEQSIPGPFPGRTVEVFDEKSMVDGLPVADRITQMFKSGMETLTGKDLNESFGMFFNADDIVGIKINPVGPGLISTRLELVDAIIAWLTANGLKRENIIIWDRFDYQLAEAGFTPERYPGIGLEGLQTFSEDAYTGKADDSVWLREDGTHISADNFDKEIYYWADVDGPKDKEYLHQHVFNEKYSYFGSLVTKKLTKIINVPVFKNTGNGISMATKNIGYGVICNTGRLHRPLFFDVCTEVLAFPTIRDKLVLNITDGLRGQYEGGPMANASFTYLYKSLFFATDPFALDMVCQEKMVAKRKEMNIKVNEHPMFTEYLRYGEKLDLGVVDPLKTEHVYVNMPG
ncbi:MAG: DUF362 domain-containing protein [Candidatus Zixiibacteriota bacterium]